MRYQFFFNFFHLVKSLGPYEWENTQEQTFFGLLTKHYMWWTTLVIMCMYHATYDQDEWGTSSDTFGPINLNTIDLPSGFLSSVCFWWCYGSIPDLSFLKSSARYNYLWWLVVKLLSFVWWNYYFSFNCPDIMIPFHVHNRVPTGALQWRTCNKYETRHNGLEN